MKQGLSRQPYGGARICDALNGMLTEKRYHFFTDVERLIVRLALEKVKLETLSDYPLKTQGGKFRITRPHSVSNLESCQIPSVH